MRNLGEFYIGTPCHLVDVRRCESCTDAEYSIKIKKTGPSQRKGSGLDTGDEGAQMAYDLRFDALFAAFKGLIRTLTTFTSGLAWVAKLQIPIRHLAAGCT